MSEKFNIENWEDALEYFEEIKEYICGDEYGEYICNLVALNRNDLMDEEFLNAYKKEIVDQANYTFNHTEMEVSERTYTKKSKKLVWKF